MSDEPQPVALLSLRTVTARVARMLVDDPRCDAVRVRLPGPDLTSSAGVGRSDMVAHVEAETANGRLFSVAVVPSESQLGDADDVPAWAFRGTYGDALSNPDSRCWTALTNGTEAMFGAFFVREFWLRRLVMARHIEALRNGVAIAPADDTVFVDLAIDLGRSPGMVVALADMLTEVSRDEIRFRDPARTQGHPAS